LGHGIDFEQNMRNLTSINYQGNKKKLLPFIFSSIYSIQPTPSSFLDGFSGTGQVSYEAKFSCDSVSACDKQLYSQLFYDVQNGLTGFPSDLQKHIDNLNNLKGTEGFISTTYSGQVGENGSSISPTDGNTRLFQYKNGIKIQAIRDYIENHYNDTLYKNILLYSLVLACAKVQNSTGHQNGYLKVFSKNSYNELYLKVPSLDFLGKNQGKFYLGDIENSVRDYHEVVYLDPPYGTCNKNLPVATRYSAFYHFWNTLILNDNPDIFGKANRRLDTKKVTDRFEVNKVQKYSNSLESLIIRSNTKHIFLSLSSQSLLSKEYVLDVFKPNRVFESNHLENVQGKSVTKDGKYTIKKPKLVEYIYYFNRS
jgi:adenine-specific DNA-methyltransferase